MFPVWSSAFTIVLGIFILGIVYAWRKWTKHFIFKGLKFIGFQKFRFSASCHNLRRAFDPQSVLNSDGNFSIEIVGFNLKACKSFKFIFNIDSINIYVNSNFFKCQNSPRKNRNSKQTNYGLYIFKYIINALEVHCRDISLIVTVGDFSNAEQIVIELIKLNRLSVCKDFANILEVDSIKIEQFVVGKQSLNSELVFHTNSIKIGRNPLLTQLDIIFSDILSLNINVRFLYFLSSFIKSTTQAEIEQSGSNETLEPFFAPWPVFLTLSVPIIDFKLILPETDPTVKYFEWLQFKLTKIALKCFISRSNFPKLTGQINRFELITKNECEEKIGMKHFCPIDNLLRRGKEQAAGQTKNLINLENIFIFNWTRADSFQRSTLPESFIINWISSILKGNPICNIQSDSLDLSSFDLDMSSFVSTQDGFDSLTYEYFLLNSKQLTADKTVFGILEQFDFNIPFEYPISSLIDHSVVLFKAGWRPLSKKTERGYWIGDGDKFLKSDWALNLQAKRARARIEDDAFESKISAISHFQRQLAESRCRLESAILSEPSSFSTHKQSADKKAQNLANILATSTDNVRADQATALIELYKSLFAEYRSLTSKSHLLTNWSLIDLVVDNFKVSLSWSPKYLGKKGTLSSLLNHIENGNQISATTIESLSTFLGGFIDIFGTEVQINLRNFSRPILIAPDLRITGPVFLVEDGVKDPDVLIKFPVRVLPDNLLSSFPELPREGTVDVLRSILPLKLYHCVLASITRPELVQASVSPYWLGCLALLDRVIDRFVKSSTEDPSPPLPGWDKLRYNVRGCHSRLTISSPCIISRITDSDPLSCTEVLNLSFPRGVNIGIIPGGIFVLKCPQSSLSVDSQYLYAVRRGLEASGAVHLWDLGISQEGPNSPKSMRSLSESSLELSQSSHIPIIKLSKTHLELKFCIKNVFNTDPCHHWSVRPIARSNCSMETEWEHHDTFKEFRSKSIAMELSGFVGENEIETSNADDIRFLYYREFERWISRYMAAPSSDIDVVKRGSLHQSAAIPEIQHRTSFASVFTEFHLSVDFSDLYICRLMNFSGIEESQALWSASQRSLLNMDWRRGIIDQHGREDWVYYYGELEFLNVHFVVTSHSLDKQSNDSNDSDFPVNIVGVKFNDLLRAPRLFYLSLDENCFQYDPDSLNVQCQTVLKRRQALITSLAEASGQLEITPSIDTERINQLSIAIDALKKRQKYYDSFLYKAQSNLFDHEVINEDPDELEFADTSHFEIYNAQLVWGLFNRDIVFKFVDELFVLQKKKFSQNRNGLILMRKMAQTVPQSSLLSMTNIPESPTNRSRSFLLSPTETIDSFFESLLERKSSPNSPFVHESAPFKASAEPEIDSQDMKRNDIRKGFDFRSPVNFRDSETISVPRVVDVSFFNPQLCFMTPTHSPAGAILVTAREAKVEFSPIFDRGLVKSQESEQLSLNDSSSLPALDAKMGTRTRITLQKASWYSGSRSNYKVWPRAFLQTCYEQDLRSLRRLTADTEITMVYDVSNAAYSWTPSSPRIKIFGHGDTIKFNSNGLSLTTTSEHFRQLLDVIVNLLVYRDPNQEARSERLETLLIAANLSDRRTFAAKMQDFRVRLDTIRCQLLGRRDFELSSAQIQNLFELYDRTERELALVGEAMRLLQASRDELNQRRSRLSLNVLIDQIQWTLLVPKLNEPSFELQPACNISLQDIMNQWISKEDGSMENTFEIGSAYFINQLPDPFYRNVLRSFDVHHGQDGVQLRATVDYGCLLRFYAKSRLPVNGITVLDHVEVDLSPLQLQLTFDIATQLYKFFLPEKINKRSSTTSRGTEDEKGILSRTFSSARARTKTEVSEMILSDQDNGPIDEVLEMKQRTEQNVFFVYVKVPPSQHLVSYKGTGKSSLLDIDRFILSLPEMEYNNRLWSWPEFFNQLRKDTIVVLLKNAGSLFKDKIKKFGKKNLPEPESKTQDEIYFLNLARKEKIDILSDETPDEKDQKNFLVFGKSIFKLMKK